MKVLRENRDSLVATLEAFVHDPLISWRLLNINKYVFLALVNDTVHCAILFLYRKCCAMLHTIYYLATSIVCVCMCVSIFAVYCYDADDNYNDEN